MSSNSNGFLTETDQFELHLSRALPKWLVKKFEKVSKFESI